jgi:hypothetical protein
MMLSPWHAPVPLTRAWCLWELFATHRAGAKFEIVLGPDEQRAFEAAILDDFDVIFSAFVGIDVAKSQTGQESDRLRIIAAVQRSIGCSALNALALEQLRQWIFATAAKVASAPGAAPALQSQVAKLFMRFRRFSEAEPLCRAALATQTEALGRSHVATLQLKMELANLLRKRAWPQVHTPSHVSIYP